MQYFVAMLLILVAEVSSSEDNFEVMECERILSVGGEISYPKVIFSLDSVPALNPLVDSSIETSIQNGLKIRGHKGTNSSIDFWKTDSFSMDKSIKSLSNYWGVDPNVIPRTYWDAIEYFIEDLDTYPLTNCDSLDGREKLDIIVFATMSPEVLLSVDQDLVFFAHNLKDDYYYYISKYTDGTFGFKLQMFVNGSVHTVVGYGDDRVDLEYVAAEIVTLNK